MLKKSSIALACAALGFAQTAAAATIYQDNNDFINLYGEVGVGGHISANAKYSHGEFYAPKGYVDDSFATIGVNGRQGQLLYRVEMDYLRQNWEGGDGEFTLLLNKLYLGYEFLPDQIVKFGLTDTAYDDYDQYGDLTFNSMAETGEAGDQGNTIKYQGKFGQWIAGLSYTYEGSHPSGAEYGDIVNGYLGFMSSEFSVVIGAEGRGGSNGTSKYGEQWLFGLGARWQADEQLTLGFNGFVEDEALSTRDSNGTYLEYQTFRNYGAVLSASYALTPQINLVAAGSYERYEAWDINSPNFDSSNIAPQYGRERTWSTVGVHYWPAKNTVFALEGRLGEAPEAAYAYARVYF
ncbi:MAG: porin [Ferrimonas sp.]